MLWIGLVVLGIAFLLWLALFAALYIKPRISSRSSIGGGTNTYTEPWTTSLEEQYEGMALQDLRMMSELLEYGGTLSIEDLEALTRETTPVLAERLRKLESMGYVTKTATGRYELTEAGRKAIELYKEKAMVKRREEELIERGV